MRGAIQWFEELGRGGKVLAVVGAAAVIFFGSYFVTLALTPTPAGDGTDASSPAASRDPGASQDASSQGTPVPVATPDPEEQALIEAQQEIYDKSDLSLEGARWEGEEVLVRGAWEGQLSSIHCDLWEGEEEGELRLTDWWDRGETVRIGRDGVAESGLERGTFSRAFGEDADGPGEDEPEEGTPYAVACSGTFSLGLTINDIVAVEGEPPPNQASAGGGGEPSRPS